MPSPPRSSRAAPALLFRSGLTMIFLGIAFAVIGPSAFDGFVKGAFQGAGVTLMVLGVALVVTRRRTRTSGLWLPSRDE
jgi:hypothetical protein